MNNLTKRILFGTGLGVVAGMLCFIGFSMGAGEAGMGQYGMWSWSNPMMWMVIVNRMTIGIVVAIAGFITIHPFCNFKVRPYLRGAKFGALISLTMAIGAFMGPSPEGMWGAFWAMVIAGAVFGSIIDVVITKLAGEGKDLK